MKMCLNKETVSAPSLTKKVEDYQESLKKIIRIHL